ncbi:DUF2958 domain-containing protein [Kocuria rosea]|uniref:DUF2958 domain-containing protein n=1 Tax=Kocuria rosea TaxID=1275 RepID=UPI0011A658C0|nr:DUF2958 domain-containing protein [Kocuria rosea]
MEKTQGKFAQSNRNRRGHDFYAGLDGIPPLYTTEDIPAENKTIHAHYFVGGADWWIAELDPGTMEAFGYCKIQTGEWGYVSLPELEAVVAGPLIAVVERDPHWTVRPFRDCRSGS